MGKKIISAGEARQLMAKSDIHLTNLLKEFEKEIRKQAENGLCWANVSCDFGDTNELVQRVKDELVLLGFTVENNRQPQFKIEW